MERCDWLSYFAGSPPIGQQAAQQVGFIARSNLSFFPSLSLSLSRTRAHLRAV